MKIGELSRATGCTVETIRYYERAGLLPTPARSEGNYRRYDRAALDRLAFIRRCRSLDMSLDEIRTLLALADAANEDCRAADTVIESHLAHVSERLRELRALQAQLRAIRAACTTPGTLAACGVLHELNEKPADIRAEGESGSHIAGVHRKHGGT